MYIDEKISDLQNLINKKVTYEDIAKALEMSGNALRNWVYRNRPLKEFEIHKIDNFFNITTHNKTDFDFSEDTDNKILKIPYWPQLPDALKIPDFTCVTAESNVIKNHWYLKPEDLCIVPMVGDKMTNYWYPIRSGDILIIDTSQNYIMGNAVYFATSQNNTRFWIREMQVLINQDIEFKGFAPSGNTTRTIPKQQLDEADFKIIGKVIKNVSFRL